MRPVRAVKARPAHQRHVEETARRRVDGESPVTALYQFKGGPQDKNPDSALSHRAKQTIRRDRACMQEV
jgi:hypothetical protein